MGTLVAMTKSKSFRVVVSLALIGMMGSAGAGIEENSPIDAHSEHDHYAEIYGKRRLRCATPALTASEKRKVESAARVRIKRYGNRRIRGEGGIIPVYVHVISSGSTLKQGNIPDALIKEQIEVLNRAYGGSLGGAGSEFKFSLVEITRTKNAAWSAMGYGSDEEKAAKSALRKGGPDALNFYLAAPGGGILGWATFPWTYEEDPKSDGVVVLNTTVPGGGQKPFDLGYTGVHEVGHWLGLWHTFQGSCSAPGDEIDDTPAQASPTSGCPASRDSCSGGGPDPLHNFMDYSDDPCMSEFTTGQTGRMEKMFSAYRMKSARERSSRRLL